nr:hypothetical protein [Actinomycetota bacterium]
ALGRTAAAEYDANGNVIEVTDRAGRKTLAEYDAENQLVTETLGDGSVRRVAYDAAGAVASRTDGAAKTTTYEHDGAGNLTEVVDPLGRRTVRQYDDNGNTVALVDALQRTTTFAYDDADRLTRASYPAPGAHEVTYTYDAEGRRATATDGTGQSTYDYDGLGRLAATHSAAGDVVRFGYDLADRRTRLTYPNGEDVTTAYDAGGRATSVTDWLGNTTAFEYDGDSNLVRKAFPTTTATADEYAYDAERQLTHATLGQSGGTLAQLDYTYGPGGEVSAIANAGLPGGAGETYEYGLAGRLSKDGLADLAYDLAGNATKLRGKSALTYDAAGQLETATTTSGTLDFDFDAVGQRTSSTPSGGSATTFGYDGAGNLTSVDAPGADEVTFRYDTHGLRSEKQVGTAAVQRYAWDHGAATPLLLKQGGTSYTHGPDGLPLASIDADGDVRYFHSDRVGSIRTVTDASGARVAAQTFDAYGNVVDRTGEDVPFGFAGQLTDAETGLVYMRARYYDPATGQFISRDPLVELTLQPYLYAGGDPVNSIDPTGLASFRIGLPSLPSLEDVSNAAAGFGDSLTFGGTQKIREALGVDSAVDYCSAAYGGGDLTGDVVSLAIPGHRLVGLGGKLVRWERASAAPRKRTAKDRIGGWVKRSGGKAGEKIGDKEEKEPGWIRKQAEKIPQAPDKIEKAEKWIEILKDSFPG